MKILVDCKTFAQALSEVAPFIPAKSPLAILEYAKITTKGDRLKIEANDSQNAIVKYMHTLESDEDGAFLIKLSEIMKLVGRIKCETISISVSDNTVILEHSKGKAEFPTVNVDEYPIFKLDNTEETEVQILASALSESVNIAKPFVSSDVLRPIMCTIHAYVKDNEFGYCATDTHKLIHGFYTMEGCDGTDISWSIIPPVFTPLIQACKTCETVIIKITDSQVTYRCGNTIIRSAQVKGRFPDFKRVIPQTWTMECAVDKSELIDALGRVKLFCNVTECVKLSISQMDMTLSVDNLDEMKKSTENIQHNGCNGNIEIGINATNAITSIGALGNGEVLMRMSEPSRPILLTHPNKDNLQIIAMPMQLVNN